MVQWQEEFLVTLRNYYALQRSKNPRYSMRALASHLGTAPGPTSALIKGTAVWNISPEWALKVIEKMNLKSTEKNRFRVLVGENPRLNVQKIDLSAEVEDSIICHWAYWPVLVHFEMTPNEVHISHIAKRLDITETEIIAIIEDLRQREFLIKLENGKYRRNSERVDHNDDIFSLAARAMHRKSLGLAQKAIEAIPASAREFQTLTIAGNSETLPQVKDEIRRFADKIALLTKQGGGNDQVYRFSIQLFPVNFGDFK